MRSIIIYLRLIRPINVLITFTAIILSSFILGRNNVSLNIFLAAVAASFTAAAGNIINDFYDVEADKINKPFRPVASEEIPKNSALRFYLIFVFVSLGIALFAGLNSLIIVFAAHILLFLYSYAFKKTVLTGNIIIAFLTGLVFLYAGITINAVQLSFIPAVFAFIITLIREIVKDIEDVKGDSVSGMNTLPVMKGINFSKTLILTLTVILILFTFQPFIFKIYSIEFFIIVMAVVNPLLIYFLRSMFKDDSAANMNKMSSLLKLNMVFGLFAIYAGI